MKWIEAKSVAQTRGAAYSILDTFSGVLDVIQADRVDEVAHS